jgi:hypothetical protein
MVPRPLHPLANSPAPASVTPTRPTPLRWLPLYGLLPCQTHLNRSTHRKFTCASQRQPKQPHHAAALAAPEGAAPAAAVLC